ncbi:hypothetical protein MMC09_000135 [Bachmanniomyces sp. S44760]|nr:hypothetical protein [Bachmanniomyces sp. S44760]
MKLLEVEQKFSYLLSQVPIFRSNKGIPPFQSIRHKAPISFQDTYFDTRSVLSSVGIYIRRRDNAWEAKERVDGDYKRSTFRETNDPSEINELICRHFKGSLDEQQNFGLDTLARFRTTRETSVVDRRFSVILDQTDFGHVVGEVEIMAEDAKKAHEDINAFMERYRWFFDTEKPKGKLTAYFDKFGLPRGC